MLKGILSKKNCADCKLCCSFYKDELWEVPTVTDEICKLTENRLNKKIESEKFDNRLIFKHEKVNNKDNIDLYFCPALNTTGCVLEDDKPFECKLWPYRIEKLNGHILVTVSPVCKDIFNKPLSELYDYYHKELHESIVEEVKKNPSIAKEYCNDYPIINIFKMPPLKFKEL